MWNQSYSKFYPNVGRKAVWEILTDVNNWSKWHGDLEYCKMQGPFTEGNYFLLKPKGGSVHKIKLVKVTEGINFTDCTSFLGAKMYDIHELEEVDSGLRLTNTIKVTGILSWLWVRLVAKHVADTAAQEQEKLIQLAREKHD